MNFFSSSRNSFATLLIMWQLFQFDFMYWILSQSRQQRWWEAAER